MKKMKIAGNRTIIGVICIVLALGITFGIAPLVGKYTDRKVSVVQMKNNVGRGHIITADDVEFVSVSVYNLSQKTVTNTEYVIGKYAATNLYSGQLVIGEQISTECNSAEDVISGLDGTKVAISVNIGSFAQGISNKIQNGDIVSVIIYDKDMSTSYTPSELKYMRVITTTTGEGVDCDEKTDAAQSATVTLLATPDQAELLAQYNSVTTLHFALVCRGDKAIADEYIRVQDEYLAGHPKLNENTQEDTNG